MKLIWIIVFVSLISLSCGNKPGTGTKPIPIKPLNIDTINKPLKRGKYIIEYVRSGDTVKIGTWKFYGNCCDDTLLTFDSLIVLMVK